MSERSARNSSNVTVLRAPRLRWNSHRPRMVTLSSARSWICSRMGPNTGLGTGV